jgi:ribosomal protein S18 acetylase RimI-like enzyme
MLYVYYPEVMMFCNLVSVMIINNVKGSFIIREANVEDLPALVNIHVTSWNATYSTYHPKPTHALREHQWRKAFQDREDNWFCYVAQKQGGEIAGFATGNDFHDEELSYEGQLNKIHFLKEYQRMGLGRVLVGCVVARFINKGFNSMILFADTGNPAIKFYDVLKGERLLDKEGTFLGAYGWKDLQVLFELCSSADSTNKGSVH